MNLSISSIFFSSEPFPSAFPFHSSRNFNQSFTIQAIVWLSSFPSDNFLIPSITQFKAHK
jgi:hypothetical protein